MAKSLPPAGFVFQGTVVRVSGATMTVPDSKETAVVRVDNVLRSPETLKGYAGTEITLRPAKGERLKRGQKAVFHTNGWLYGKGLAVQSVGHEAIAKKAALAMNAMGPDPVRAADSHAVAQRAQDAPIVITGKVVAVGLPGQGQRVAARSATRTARAPISEHDPGWKEAIVEVEEIHKGSLQKKQVVVRFPSSHDVSWHNAPKFQVGQEGVFLLHPDQVSEVPSIGVAAVAHNVAPAAFTALQPTDFQGLDHPQAVAAALQAISPNA
jgi:hypothetical protein